MHDDFTCTDVQYMEAIKEWLEQEKDRPDTDYYKELYQRYLLIKKDQKANIKFGTVKSYAQIRLQTPAE